MPKSKRANSNRDLSQEAELLLGSYRERSRFFAARIKQKAQELQQWLSHLSRLDSNQLDWSKWAQWGITENAWKKVQAVGVPPHHLFAHPNVLSDNPGLLEYYRLLACLPKKGLDQLCRGAIGEQRHQRRLFWLNRFLSALVEDSLAGSEMLRSCLVYAQAGSELQGSWVNEIGKNASDRVWNLLTDFARRNGWRVEGNKIVLPNSVQLTRQSEPDIEARSAQGNLLAVVEIKGSLDPAGAQTQYGEAKKSFQKALSENPRCETIYLASCLTDAVRELIEKDGQVRRLYDLTRLLTDQAYQNEFLTDLFSHVLRS